MPAITENQKNPEKDMTGAVKPSAVKTSGGAAKASPTTVQHVEPEDAYLTGGQRNLQRRMLGLNVDGKTTPPQSPGLHATGSFTGVANGKSQPREEDPSAQG